MSVLFSTIGSSSVCEVSGRERGTCGRKSSTKCCSCSSFATSAWIGVVGIESCIEWRRMGGLRLSRGTHFGDTIRCGMTGDVKRLLKSKSAAAVSTDIFAVFKMRRSIILNSRSKLLIRSSCNNDSVTWRPLLSIRMDCMEPSKWSSCIFISALSATILQRMKNLDIVGDSRDVCTSIDPIVVARFHP